MILQLSALAKEDLVCGKISTVPLKSLDNDCLRRSCIDISKIERV